MTRHAVHHHDATERSTAAALEMLEVTKVFGKGASAVTALDGVSVTIAPGTFTAVMGPSGSGKTTLLHCAAGLERPTSGSVQVAGTDLTGMNETALTRLRRERIGFVFQAFNLLPSLTVAQNVVLPLHLAGRRPAHGAAGAALASVGLLETRKRRPSQLSGGQQQRVAIARALVARPDVVFADEPTGALDTATGHDVLSSLRSIVDDDGHTVVMVTHDPVAASFADSVLFLVDGRLDGSLTAPTAESVADRMARIGRGR